MLSLGRQATDFDVEFDFDHRPGIVFRSITKCSHQMVSERDSLPLFKSNSKPVTSFSKPVTWLTNCQRLICITLHNCFYPNQTAQFGNEMIRKLICTGLVIMIFICEQSFILSHYHWKV